MNEYAKYRLEVAEERAATTKILIDLGAYRDSINRSYYAIFTAARALLADRDVDFKKYSAVISYFRREYIRTGLFDEKFSDYIGKAFRLRNDCDYGDFVIVSREMAETQYQQAIEFVEAVKTFLGGDADGN